MGKFNIEKSNKMFDNQYNSSTIDLGQLILINFAH